MFRKMPFILLALILFLGIAHPWIPLSYKSIIYAVSLSLKSIIIFTLPLLIFGLLYKTAVQLSKKASKLILLLLGAICLSNFISTMISYSVGSLAYCFDLSMTMPQGNDTLQPAWILILPKWTSNDRAMLAGLFLGVVLSWLRPNWANTLSRHFDRGVSFILKGFLLIIPFFLTGFVLKMYHDALMLAMVRNYALIFGLVTGAVFLYIAMIYWVGSHFRGAAFIKSLKNMLPAAIAGFGSMSSAAAMPLTLIGTEKNSDNPDLARSVIPATVNIHLIGDCFAIPIFAFAVMKNFGVAEPAFIAYVLFAVYFVLAKFSVAAVPGGGILVMLPILETYLGFNAEMLSLITALYILFDPVITCANVMGNGGFALSFCKFFSPKAIRT